MESNPMPLNSLLPLRVLGRQARRQPGNEEFVQNSENELCLTTKQSFKLMLTVWMNIFTSFISLKR